MGGHGHDHGPPYVVPDYKIYKVEDAPQLIATQKALASHGLKDPWLRNEVWRGLGVGLIATFVTIGATTAYDTMYPSEHNHPGHNGNGDESH